MSISNYKRYVICPECNDELIADGLMARFRRAHKKELSAVEIDTILSQGTHERTRKPNPPPNPRKSWAKLQRRRRKNIERKMKKFSETTPFSMRQWGVDRPHRTGPM